jgi:two-component system, LytTR family, response regulator
MILHCIAIDDEPPALTKIGDYAARIPFLSLDAVFTLPVEALQYLNDHEVDLIFLDVEMDILNGIQLLEILEHKPQVILTTAYDRYALKGYELDVADYLLKPFGFDRFLKSVNKVYRIKALSINCLVDQTDTDHTDRRLLFLKSGQTVHKIDIGDIQYIEGMKEYLGIRTVSQRVVVLMSFKQIEAQLPVGEFIRIHRSYLVPIRKIDRVKNHHVVINETELPIGKSYREGFYKQIKGL